MKPATEEEIEQLKRDFEQFVKLGNGTLKAAYLATSGRGFTETKGAKKNTVVLCRESDNTFICFSSECRKIPERINTLIDFSTNTDDFKKKEGDK